MKFYLGTHQPIWLTRIHDVPLLVSHRRLGHRRTLPRAVTEWALDSGGFTELQLHGRWQTDERSYVRAVRRYADEIGNLTWCSPQDWMCEPHVLKRTGLTVREHQRRTVRNFVSLRELAPEQPWVPILQGWDLSEYEQCAEFYERAGIDLASEPRVGVGTVCRRQHKADVERIMRAFAARNLRLHGFGIKIGGLSQYAEALSSSDSMAWSRRGRYVAGCTPSHRTESNCLRFALSWYRQIQATLGSAGPSVEGTCPGPLARVA